MSDILNDRERALENEYIRRREREGLERLRTQMRSEAEGAATAEGAGLRCPRDGGALVAVKLEDVEVDRCPDCGGLWLDAGELEQLTHADAGGGFFNRMRRTISGE